MALLAEGTVRRHARRITSRYSVVYWAMLLLSLHWAVVTYINSTYIEQFVGQQAIGLFYIIGSSLTILAFLFVSRVLHRLGNYRFTINLAILEFFVLLGLAFIPDVRFVIPLFVLHHAIVPLLLFNLDVFLESLIGDHENRTGGKRGILLTVMSLAGAIAPLLSGFLIGDGEPRFWLAYTVGALFMIPFGFVILKNLKTFKDPKYRDIEVLGALRRFWINQDLRFVFIAHFLLQLFFSFMVIYTPLYLATEIGFGWQEIGLILFVGLMAYVLLEYPIGEMADRYLGETEMMALGFFIMLIATGWLSFIATAAIVPWMVSLFLTRVGASLVETTTESYFFKHIVGSDANVISFFRITRPLAYIAGALFGSIAFLFLPFSMLFFALALLLIPGVVLALMLEDTR